jgi:hypothetical protein
MSTDAIFNRDYESAIILSENVIQDISYAIIALITQFLLSFKL